LIEFYNRGAPGEDEGTPEKRKMKEWMKKKKSALRLFRKIQSLFSVVSSSSVLSVVNIDKPWGLP